MDVSVVNAADPLSNSWVRIWGIGLSDIKQSANLNGKNITVYGGMSKGLPLANPNQAGLLFKGNIFQAFGNWTGTAQTLDLIVQAGPSTASRPGGTGSAEAPLNLVLQWNAGQTMQTALEQCLRTTFPDAKREFSISSDLVQGQDVNVPAATLENLAQYCGEASRSIIKTANYRGVGIAFDGATFRVDDGTSTVTQPKQILFQDLIGQPTWIAPNVVSAKMVMRGDLQFGQLIQMPAALVRNTTGGASSVANQQPSFQGTFQIIELRHCGDFRNPQPDAWVTIVNAVVDRNQ